MSFISIADDQCWNWTGTVRSQDKPYGRLIIGSRSDGSRRSVAAHRLSYEIHVGPIPDELCVCHRCDNPRCINPDHLFLGTKKENADDRDHKGRLKKAPIRRGQAHAQSKLTDQQRLEIASSPATSTVLAKVYGVDASTIRSIKREWKTPAPEPKP